MKPHRTHPDLPGYLALLIILFVFLVVLFFFPLASVVYTSFHDAARASQSYLHVFGTEVYLWVFLNTLYITAWVVCITLLLGYILAFMLFKARGIWFYLLLVLILSPLLMDQLSRNFAWMMILDNDGLINVALKALGLIHQPIQLIYNRIGVIIVLVHGFTPIMALSIYTALSSIEKELPIASRSLGANRLQTFLHVYLPLTAPGSLSGSFFVAILTFGYYITPAMLGGRKGIMVAKIVDQLLNRQGDEQGATAISTILVLVCLPTVYVLTKAFSNFGRENSQ